MVKLSFLIFIAGTVLAPQVLHAEIPRCLSAVCIGDKFQPTQTGFSFQLIHQDRENCPRFQMFLSEIEGGSLEVHVETEKSAVFQLKRVIYIDDDNSENYVSTWSQMLVEKYGKYDKIVSVDDENPWWRFTKDSAGSEGSPSLRMHVAVSFTDRAFRKKFPGKIRIETNLTDDSIFDIMMPDRSCFVEKSLPD